MVLLTIFFVACNVTLLPFAYLKGLLLKIVHLTSKNNKSRRVFQLFFFLIFGIGILVLNFVADLMAFWIHMY